MSINAWGSDDPAEVAKGGTGNATLTDGGILLGSGTSPVTVTSQPTDGQVLIGSTGSDPALAVPSGTSDEIDVTGGSGSLTIGLADDLVMPGNASYTWVDGTTAQEPAGSAGEARYDTDTNEFMGHDGTSWQPFSMGGGSSGLIVQVQYTQNKNTGTIATTMPLATGVPNIAQGGTVCSVSITPTSATNLLWIHAQCMGCYNDPVGAVYAIFQDATAAAIAANVSQGTASSLKVAAGYVDYFMIAGTTSSTTFQLRVGANATPFYLNQYNTTNQALGAANHSSIQVWEITV